MQPAQEEQVPIQKIPVPSIRAFASPPGEDGPYIGLRPFDEPDKGNFFGRKDHISNVLQKLGRQRFVAVIGLSGAGKSSIVLAGVIPEIRKGRLPDAGSDWVVIKMTPGDSPVKSLSDSVVRDVSKYFADRHTPDAEARQELESKLKSWKLTVPAVIRRGPRGLLQALHEAELPAATEVLVVVDQFEELFRFEQLSPLKDQAKEDEGEAMIQKLLYASGKPVEGETNSDPRPGSRTIYVVITMRSEFLGDCTSIPGLAEAVNEGMYLTPRLKSEELKLSIVLPAKKMSQEIDPELVGRLVNTNVADQDQLPVLQHLLMRCWEKRRPGRALDLEDYDQAGGEDALGKHAQEVLEEVARDLGEPARGIAEKVFKRITKPGSAERLQDSVASALRDAAPLDVICTQIGEKPEAVKAVVDRFRRRDRAFLRPFLRPEAPDPLNDDSIIDITHESLIRKWKALNEWVKSEDTAHYKYERLLEHVRRKTKLTEGEVRDYLRIGQENQWNRNWSTRYADSEDYELSQTFLKDRLDRIERNHHLKTFAYVLLLAVVVLGSLWYVLMDQKGEYQRSKPAIAAEILPSMQNGNDTLKTQKIKALAALSQDPNNPGLKDVALWQQLFVAWPRADQVLKPIRDKPAEGLNRLSISASGKYLLAATADRSVTLWRESPAGFTARSPSPPLEPDGVRALRFSNDETHFLVGGKDGVLRIYDLTKPVPGAPWAKSLGTEIYASAFSPDAACVAVVTAQYVGMYPLNTSVKSACGPTETKKDLNVVRAEFDSDGNHLLTEWKDNTIHLYSLSYGPAPSIREVATFPVKDGVSPLAMEQSGKLFAVADGDRTLTFYDSGSGKPIALVALPQKALSVAFHLGKDKDKYVAAGGINGLVMIYNLDGLYNRTVDLNKQQLPQIQMPGPVFKVEFDRTGQKLAVAVGGKDQKTGSFHVVETMGGRELVHIDHPAQVNEVSLGPDGEAVFAALDGYVGRVGPKTMPKPFESGNAWEPAPCVDHPAQMALADGDALWAYACDATLAVEGYKFHGPPRNSSVVDVDLSYSGNSIAWIEKGKHENDPDLLSVASLKAGQIEGLASVSCGASATAVAINVDGTRAACILKDNRGIRLFDASRSNGGDGTLRADEGHAGPVPEGGTVFSFGTNGANGAKGAWAAGLAGGDVQYWDGKSLKVIAHLRSAINALALSPDGNRLAVATRQLTLVLKTDLQGEDLHPLSLPGGRLVAFGGDSGYLAVAGTNGVELYRIASDGSSSSPEETIEIADRDIQAIAFNKDAKFISVAVNYGSVVSKQRYPIGQNHEIAQEVCRTLPKDESNFTQKKWAELSQLTSGKLWAWLIPSDICAKK